MSKVLMSMLKCEMSFTAGDDNIYVNGGCYDVLHVQGRQANFHLQMLPPSGPDTRNRCCDESLPQWLASGE